jgi:apolipoprotein N-acyltransferase
LSDVALAPRTTSLAPVLGRYAVAALAGALLHAAFPPRTVWWTAIIAFALLWPVLPLVAALAVPTSVGALRHNENTVIVWDPKTGAGQSYAKQELVPFAEHIPLRRLASLVTPFADTPDLRAGTEPGVLDVAGTRVGVGICYEVAYDAVLRESAALGAQVFVVPTNNAWSGRPGCSSRIRS